jgi:hypothetical protein
MACMFVPMTLMVVAHVRHDEAGAASSLLNIGQQVGGSIGLAAIGTIAWTTVASTVRSSLAAAGAAAGAAGAAGEGAAAAGGSGGAAGITELPRAILDHGLTVGFSRGLMIAGFVMLSAFFVALVATATPEAGWRPVSARLDREQPCDDVLGTCEPEAVLKPKG